MEIIYIQIVLVKFLYSNLIRKKEVLKLNRKDESQLTWKMNVEKRVLLIKFTITGYFTSIYGKSNL